MTTPDALLPGFSPPDPAPRRWLVELVGGEQQTVEAIGWRVEGGVLVVLSPLQEQPNHR